MMRIRMFLGLLDSDPDPLVRGAAPDSAPYGIWILISSIKNGKKTLDSYCVVTSLWLFIFKNDVNVPSKSNKQKNLEKNSFLLASWRSLMKIAGSGNWSAPKCHRSATLLGGSNLNAGICWITYPSNVRQWNLTSLWLLAFYSIRIKTCMEQLKCLGMI